MENLLWLLIVIIFILQGIAKLIKMAKPKARAEAEEAPSPEEYFASIGLPVEEIETKPVPQRPIPEEKAVRPTREIKREEPRLVGALPPEEILPLFISAKTVQQGIILSEILGPPKAKRGRR